MTTTEPLRWGILGTGMIAAKFAADLPNTTRGELAAVGSRRQETAERFCSEHGGTGHGSYDSLLEDDAVEAVYLSLPNGMHHEWTLKALAAGKHVLCEKPIASTRAQAEEMFAAAGEAGRVLIEAFMYRTHPAVQRFIELAREGAVGELRLIRSNFSFGRAASNDDGRYQRDQAGGSLMDVGCYCVNFCRAVVGEEPTAVQAICHRHELGVDDYAAGTLDFAGRTLATFTCGMTAPGEWTTVVGGSEGYLAIESPWFSNGKFRMVRGGQREDFELAAPLNEYALEAETFARAVQDGEPAWITADDSLGNMQVLDDLRRQLDLMP